MRRAKTNLASGRSVAHICLRLGPCSIPLEQSCMAARTDPSTSGSRWAAIQEESSYPPWLEVYQQQYRELLEVARRITGCTAEAEDVLQDVVVRLLHQRRAPQRQINGAYLNAAVRNRAYNVRRNELRHQAALSTYLQPESESPRSDADDTLDLDRRALLVINQAVGTLPARRRHVLLTVRFEGLTHQQAAVRLGVSTRVVEREMQKALIVIRNALEREREREANGTHLRPRIRSQATSLRNVKTNACVSLRQPGPRRAPRVDRPRSGCCFPFNGCCCR
jgi:RNA polymerase sigma-70 factor (ECF subfamily)